MCMHIITTVRQKLKIDVIGQGQGGGKCGQTFTGLPPAAVFLDFLVRYRQRQ